MCGAIEKEERITPEKLKEAVRILKEWISQEPHLPKIEDDWLEMCLHHNKYHSEKTKTKIENYFSFRSKYPEVLKNRDPLGPDIVQNRKAIVLCAADKLTEDGGRILFIRFLPDPSIYDVTAHLKRFFMIADLFYFEKHSYCAGIADFQNLTYRHVLRGSSGIKIILDVFMNAYSSRFKALYIINFPAGLEPVLNTVKSLLPAKIAKRLYFHSSPAELFKIVDENIVCSDFGGKGPSLSEYDEYTTRLLEERRDWFLEQDNVCSNEALRRKTQDQPREMEGFFRKLDVD